ncbi:MAG TPA: PilX N-terminal domain-containing pilus assembly protein [Steroidobacteraceae bacterium]|nr:PilX N-terminal domain-containing pilus assembly protein [Steroidobacteraceae bacterium]
MKTPAKQRGAALVVGLMMLVVVTLLAVTAVSTSSTELVMAGNEQFRDRAFQAAEAGIENAIRKSRSTDSDVPYKYLAYVDLNNLTMASDSADGHSTRLQAVGATKMVGKSSKFIGQLYKISTTGTSARNSQSAHEVGAWVLSPWDDATFDAASGPINDGSGSDFGTFP